jgi:hypothetical protein
MYIQLGLSTIEFQGVRNLQILARAPSSLNTNQNSQYQTRISHDIDTNLT